MLIILLFLILPSSCLAQIFTERFNYFIPDTSNFGGRLPSKKYNRKKGHDFEREIAAEFREMGYEQAKRNLEYNEGETGIDLVNTGMFDVQCKRRKNYCSVNTIKEIKGYKMPLLITKANGDEAMAILRWEDLKKIVGDIFGWFCSICGHYNRKEDSVCASCGASK